MMNRFYYFSLLLWGLLLTHQTARADNVIVFSETFNETGGTGGRDGQFTGNIAQNAIKYDVVGWSDASCQGASQCLKFGSSSANGVCTTPAISLTGTPLAVLTFSAAGWGTGTNTLSVTISAGTSTGDVSIELENGIWNDYSVVIKDAYNFTVTFTGKRGFLDDVVVTHITSVDAPSMTESCTFWPNATEAPSKSITITPALGTTVRYTTDGSVPTTVNGTEATLTTSFSVHATTTVKAIAYVADVVSDVVTKTYTLGSTTVNGIAAFQALADGTEARLFLAADANARVLHGHNNQEMYLRDNSGTLCLDFGTTAIFNPAPVHNQHAAGWIVGQKQTVDGLTKLVATSNTNTDYLALAAPVTEAPTEPTAVDDIAKVNQYLGDWVTVQDVREGLGQLTVSNLFGAEHFTDVYAQSLVDVSGIVTANSTIAPVYYNGIRPIVYVIDENEDFHSPDNDIENATIRLKRTLGKDYWNTFVVPFDMASIEGDIRVCDDVEGNTMRFVEATSMEAGKPYLVRPYENIVNPVFTDIKLSATSALSIDKGNYAFVGIYSPKDLKTDGTELFLKSDGKLYHPEDESSSRIKGMRAYFKVPAGQEVRLYVENDDVMGIETMYNEQRTSNNVVYDLQGRSVTQPTKGIYIKNGKKLIIH